MITRAIVIRCVARTAHNWSVTKPHAPWRRLPRNGETTLELGRTWMRGFARAERNSMLGSGLSLERSLVPDILVAHRNLVCYMGWAVLLYKRLEKRVIDHTNSAYYDASRILSTQQNKLCT